MVSLKNLSSINDFSCFKRSIQLGLDWFYFCSFILCTLTYLCSNNKFNDFFFLAPTIEQVYFQFIPREQMHYYKIMHFVIQLYFPSMITTLCCAQYVSGAGKWCWGAVDGRIAQGTKFISTGPCPNQRSSELLLNFHLHSNFRVHRSFVLSTVTYHISASWGIALRVLTSEQINTNPSSLSWTVHFWMIYLYKQLGMATVTLFNIGFLYRFICEEKWLCALLPSNAGSPAFGANGSNA